MNHTEQAQLRKRLCALDPTALQLVTVCLKAGLPVHRVNTSGSGEAVWFPVVQVAEQHRALESLASVVEAMELTPTRTFTEGSPLHCPHCGHKLKVDIA